MFIDYQLKVWREGPKITCELTAPPLMFDGVREVIHRKIIDAEDAMIRKMLIEIGWTPPDGKDTNLKE